MNLRLRSFNVLGLMMLLSAFFSTEVVYLNRGHEANVFLIALAITYMSVGLWLAFKKG